jgi:DNA-directed RNA polymerase subunit RPC12/RpoP
MSISVVCTSCGKKYRLKDEREGKKFRCKGCEQVLIVTQSPQPATTKQTEAGDQSTKRRPKSSDDQPDRRRRKRKKKPVADPYAHGDDLYGSTLDRFDGDYGEDFPEDDNPYRAPSHQGSAARRRRGGRETPPLTMCKNYPRSMDASTAGPAGDFPSPSFWYFSSWFPSLHLLPLRLMSPYSQGLQC